MLQLFKFQRGGLFNCQLSAEHVPVRYYSYENVTTVEDRSPTIEVCYKKTTLKVCGPNDIRVLRRGILNKHNCYHVYLNHIYCCPGCNIIIGSQIKDIQVTCACPCFSFTPCKCVF